MRVVALVAASYFIGSLSPAYIVGRVMGGFDIREHGSGNAGTTNVMRLFGAKAAVLVLFLDLVKGMAAVLIGRFLGNEMTAVLCGMAAVLGHNWPIMMKFKGGKGVATTMGVGFMINAPLAWIGLGLAIVIIMATRYVSLASIVCIPVWTLMLWATGAEMVHIYLGVALSLLAIVRHRNNINRIINGTENRFDFKKKLNRS